MASQNELKNYNKVNQYLAKHPDATKQEAFAELGVHAGGYYKVRKEMTGGGRTKQLSKMPEVIDVAMPSSAQRVAVVVGSPKDVKDILAGLL